eukprot:scaffold684_cov345-Pavlova_lutheri.AAC.38
MPSVQACLCIIESSRNARSMQHPSCFRKFSTVCSKDSPGTTRPDLDSTHLICTPSYVQGLVSSRSGVTLVWRGWRRAASSLTFSANNASFCSSLSPPSASLDTVLSLARPSTRQAPSAAGEDSMDSRGSRLGSRTVDAWARPSWLNSAVAFWSMRRPVGCSSHRVPCEYKGPIHSISGRDPAFVLKAAGSLVGALAGTLPAVVGAMPN